MQTNELWSYAWHTCEVSTLYLETANARWMNVFWVVNPLFLTHLENGRIVNLFTTCPGESLTYLWNFNSVSVKLCECNCANARCNGRISNLSTTYPGKSLTKLKFQCCILTTVANARRIHVFGCLTLYFWPHSTTCPEKSLTFLWSFNSLSWKLWEYTTNSCFLSD